MAAACYRISRGCQPVASMKRSWLTGSMSSRTSAKPASSRTRSNRGESGLRAQRVPSATGRASLRHTRAAGTTVVPVERFEINVDEAVLADLRDRIRSSRLPGPAPGEPWSQGTDDAYLRDFLGVWADGYDWRTSEGELNRFAQFRTRLDGVQIHSSMRAPPPAAAFRSS